MEESDEIIPCDGKCRTYFDKCFCQCFPPIGDEWMINYRKQREDDSKELRFRCWTCATTKKHYRGGPCKHNQKQHKQMCYKITKETAETGMISPETVLIWYQILIQNENPLLNEVIFFNYQQIEGSFGMTISTAVAASGASISNNLLDIIGYSGSLCINLNFKYDVMNYARYRFMSVVVRLYLFLVKHLGKDMAKLIMSICHDDGLSLHTNGWKALIQSRWTKGWQQLLE